MRIKLYIISLFLLSGLLFAENTLSLEDNGDGTWDVNYESEVSIGYFQFVLENASIVDALGGDAIDYGFMVFPADLTVFGYGSVIGASIPPGTGTLLVMEIIEDPVFTGLSGLIIDNDFGIEIEDFTYEVDGCTVGEACNFIPYATDDDGSCNYPEEYYDCDGNCTTETDCAGDCGGIAELDECGVCDGDGIPIGDCDCNGNIDDCAGECGGNAEADECSVCGGDGIPIGDCDCNGNIEDCAGDCGGTAELDECGICDGSGADIECEDGSYVCDISECNTGGDWDGDACSMPINTVHLTAGGDVLFNAGTPLAGFQMNVDGGATISSAGGGEAGAAGFMISASGNTVLGFSLTGATFDGCGTMVELELDGDARGLRGSVN